MENEQSSDKPKPEIKQPSTPRVLPVRHVGYIKRKLQERHASRDKENPEQKAARRTANATWWIAIFTIILTAVGGITLIEVIGGGSDTHKLADAALANTRGWVVISGTGFQYVSDNRGVARTNGTVVLINTGPSPAFEVTGWRCAQVRESDPAIQADKPIDVPDCVEDGIGMMGRGIPVTLNVNDASQIVPKGSISESMHRPGPHFYVWGRFTYNVYPADGPHFISFCLLNAGTQLGPCKHGNDGN